MNTDTTSSPGRAAEQPISARLYGSACDTCRRRRVKCDGQQPCARCVRSNVACTYGSLVSRKSSVSYARHLEEQIERLQTVLQEQSQTASGESPSPTMNRQAAATILSIDMLVGPEDDYVCHTPQTSSHLFYGRLGGLRVLNSVRQPLVLARRSPGGSMPPCELMEAFDDLTPFRRHSSVEGSGPLPLLPPKEQVIKHVSYACKTALVCHDCLDHKRFSGQLDRLFETDPEEYSADDERFLAVVYALMSLSMRYSPSDSAHQVQESLGRAKLRGSRYFQASRQLVEDVERHNLDSLRALICQGRYFLSMSMVSKAHTCISAGVSAALRMGLHTSGSQGLALFSRDEIFQHRRVFAVLNMMNTYLSSLLGLPKILKGADTGSTLGLYDEDLPDQGRTYVLQNPTDPSADAVLCQKLNNILEKISEARSATTKILIHNVGETYQEPSHFVTLCEAELREWHNDLPAIPEDTLDIVALQSQLILRLWHAMAQIILYRPFLHHLARDVQDPKFSICGYEYGSACVQAAMQAVWLIEAFQKNSILHEAYYLILYILGYAAHILAFFVTSSSWRATITESTVAALKARDILEFLGRYNPSARATAMSLNVLLDTLPTVPERTPTSEP
ncbi:hypothetical protein POJ06DRAFT_262741 [Lipomyces tetrasporus]|uniref:Zn(2)-C6 fungal-type domain-containing protein n=1 Tax=Lipomyces tetrasporus TaxID=54092 RepID=A0AAD7QLM9_9ASCO|nr:uncharacterized protein POJ06DRAFT_262741 [Lipomyces tetrasporus]KAJ8097200.1 hypothetical protein POJ06DRAFT_262741 [Lipomyces tetrasporus]